MTLTADELMTSFAERTGLTSSRLQRRYLWTDAFAVCNFLGADHRELALELIRHVHQELGHHRGHRRWISGLSDVEGEAHPTIGGLRIGKPLPERHAGEPCDENTEWDRDGQYFHYLTKWMHALDQVARATRDAKLAAWSRELAVTAHHRFLYTEGAARRMYWKMSVDLSRPQVSSMGHHDPLDGYITALQLHATARKLGARGSELEAVIADYRSMIEPAALATADPLGIGGLLFDAGRLAQLDRDPVLRAAIIEAATIGLEHYVRQRDLQAPAERRLAFRELGLAIGLAVEDTIELDLGPGARVRDAINAFWVSPAHRKSSSYRDHLDINDVMLATSLAPTGFIALAR